MIKIVISIFLILHGLVHLLYLGQSQRFFELQPGMVWPDGSWVFGRILGSEPTRLLASAACVVAAVGFAATGMGILLDQNWWKTPLVFTAIFSSIVYLLLWNGKLEHLDNQGAIGILINLALLGITYTVGWPNFAV